MPNSSPKTLNDLKAKIADEHQSLSKRLRQVAKYFLDNPNDIAFGTVAVIAKDAGVHPSTLVRFANAFGYSGFSEMQRIFQQHLLHESPSYTDRIRIARETLGEDEASPVRLLEQFASANSATLDHLVGEIDYSALEKAEELLQQANNIHVMGVRRAFVVASYFVYALRHVDRRAFLIDSVGCMTMEQSGNMQQDDVLVAVSFHPYAEETQKVAQQAMESGVPLILITDSELSPLASKAAAKIVVREAEVHGIRSLSSSLCVAQSLSVGLAGKPE